MGRWAEHILAGAAALFAGFLLLWEAGQPVVAAHFMMVLGRFDPKVCVIMAPFAFGAALTIIGMVAGFASLRLGRAASAVIWFIVGDVVAPIFAFIGHNAATGLVGMLAI